MSKVKSQADELAVVHERTIPAEIGLQHWKRKAEHLEKSMGEWSESRQADVSRLQKQASEAENARHQALLDLHACRQEVAEEGFRAAAEASRSHLCVLLFLLLLLLRHCHEGHRHQGRLRRWMRRQA